MNTKVRIFLADDHQLLIDGLHAVIRTNPNMEVVGHALDGTNLIEMATEAQADILVMDINMPEKDGITVLREQSGNELPFRIVILSSYDDVKLVREVMKLGASGYLTKQCAGDQIAEAIEAVLNGEEYFDSTIRQNILNAFGKENQNASNASGLFGSNLTDRELEVVRLLAMEYSGKEIGEELFISPHTVETHRKNILKKLNISTTVGLVKYAIKHNLVNP